MILLNDFKGGKKYPSRRAQVLKEDDAVFVELTEFWGMESNHKGWFKKWRPMGSSLNEHYALDCAKSFVNGKGEFA